MAKEKRRIKVDALKSFGSDTDTAKVMEAMLNPQAHAEATPAPEAPKEAPAAVPEGVPGEASVSSAPSAEARAENLITLINASADLLDRLKPQRRSERFIVMTTPDLKAAIELEAETRQKSKNEVVCRALERYLADALEQIQKARLEAIGQEISKRGLDKKFSGNEKE